MQDEEYMRPAPAGPSVEAAAATLDGLRALNADAHLIDETAGLYMVADGMGQTPRAQEAARTALCAVRATFQAPWALLPQGERTPGEAADRFVHGIARAQLQLYVHGVAREKRAGTTLAGLVVCGGDGTRGRPRR